MNDSGQSGVTLSASETGRAWGHPLPLGSGPPPPHDEHLRQDGGQQAQFHAGVKQQRQHDELHESHGFPDQ
jgi:hypothetical protein